MNRIIDEEQYSNELNKLCAANGRVIEITKDNKIMTFDRYEGTDARFFETYEEAVEWEKGYTSAKDLPSDFDVFQSVADPTRGLGGQHL